MHRVGILANTLWLQAGWWLCVLGAQRPAWLLAVPLGVALHWLGCRARRAEARALVRVTLAGCLLDSVLGMLGLFAFDAYPLPLWLALLWLVLACGLRHSLAWAARAPWLGAAAGALGGPLAYLAGARLAAVELPLGALITGLCLAPVWALALPGLARLAADDERTT